MSASASGCDVSFPAAIERCVASANRAAECAGPQRAAVGMRECRGNRDIALLRLTGDQQQGFSDALIHLDVIVIHWILAHHPAHPADHLTGVPIVVDDVGRALAHRVWMPRLVVDGASGRLRVAQHRCRWLVQCKPGCQTFR